MLNINIKLSEYELNSLDKIEDWEKSKHTGIQERILDIASSPVDYVINKIGIEKFDMFQNAVETALNKMVGASRYTVFPEKLFKRVHDSGTKIKSWTELATCDLKQLDTCNRSIVGFHKKLQLHRGLWQVPEVLL